jgi:hypothetical protein
VLGNNARWLFVCGRWRWLVTTAEHQAEDGERKLGVVLRQLFSLLAKETALESLVFLTQMRVELLVLVTLVLRFLKSFGVRNRLGIDVKATRSLTKQRMPNRRSPVKS